MNTHHEAGRGAGRDTLKDAPRLLERKVRLARGMIAFERVWRAMLWPFAVAGLFLLLSLIEAWSYLPPIIHQGGLLLFGGLLLASLVPLARIRIPTREEGLRRLEEVSGIAHRPATSFVDELDESATNEQSTLWGMHRRRLAESISRLTAGWPHPRLARNDPYALRAALLLLLVIGFASAGGSTWERIARAVMFDGIETASRYRISAWVTPPLYTAKPPVVLSDGNIEGQSVSQVTTPEKSLLLIRVNGPEGSRPGVRVSTNDDSLNEAVEPTSSATGFEEYKISITDPVTVTVGKTGLSYVTWSFDVIKDAKPEITLTQDPNRTPRGALRFAYRVSDDYGVASADARFALPERGQPKSDDKSGSDPHIDEEALKAFEPPNFPLNLPRANAKLAEGRTFRDLTSHPWAGLKVTMTLAVRDQAGQEGFSKPYEIVLPARKFNKPLAKAIIEQRKNLVRRPDERDPVRRALNALTLVPEKFMEDKVLYTGLRSAYWRLRHDRSNEGLKSVVGQLWNLALRVEDGDLPQAEADLRAAQEELRKALENGASDAEIAKLIDKLRSALNRFLQAMAEKARQNGNLAKMPEGLGPNQMLSTKDLEEMLRNIQNLAKTGSREMAQRMLEQLSNMMQRLQMGQANPNQQSQQMMNALQGLGEVIQRQQKLLDETFKERRKLGAGDMERQQGEGGQREGRSQRDGGIGQRFGQRGQQGREGQQGQGQQNEGRQGRQGMGQRGQGDGQQRGRGGGSGNRRYGELSNRQGAVRDRLDGLLEQLRTFGTKPPDQLEGAGRAMREAEKALGDENLGRATQQQTLALDRLRQGTQSVAEQVLQQLSTRMGARWPAQQGSAGASRTHPGT